MFSIVLLVEIALSLLQIILLIGLAYVYFLLFASLPRPMKRPREAAPAKTFAIAIPAHNEAVVIGKTVRRLMQQDYPAEQYAVYVVADYCTDNTAQEARDAGATCYERNEGPRGRKAYPLHWLLQQIVNGPCQYDAIAIFDADSQVDAGFLRAMASELHAGHIALQGQHLIVNPGDSSLSRLAAIDMRLNNLLHNRSKRNLNLSSRLMGDAMCLSTDLIRTHGWGGESLAEDREFEMNLLLQGQRVRYVPDAISYGQAVSRWSDASRQRVRWYGGGFDLRKNFTGRLLSRGLVKRDLAVLDRAIELLLPSFSTLIVAAIGLAAAHMHGHGNGLRLLLPIWVTLLSVLAWVVFPVAGLIVDRAPAWAYQALVYAPIYILWRIAQGLQATFKRGRVDWVRTRRREE